jgi:hypothetical protein
MFGVLSRGSPGKVMRRAFPTEELAQTALIKRIQAKIAKMKKIVAAFRKGASSTSSGARR